MEFFLDVLYVVGIGIWRWHDEMWWFLNVAMMPLRVEVISCYWSEFEKLDSSTVGGCTRWSD